MKLRATGVIVRFIPLLDVAFLLIGMFLLVMAQAQMQVSRPPAAAPAAAAQGVGQQDGGGLADAAGIDFVYLYAGTFGSERGRVYQLGPDRQPIREIRTDTRAEIDRLLRRAGRQAGQRVVLLLISDRGFDAMWDAGRIAALEKAWAARVVPVYNWRG